MAIVMHRWFAVVVWMLSLAGSSFAEDLKKQRLGFFAFGVPEFPASIYVRTGAREFKEVELMGANATAMMDVVFDAEAACILLYGAPVSNAEGGLIHPVVGRAKTNASWREAFVILAGEKKGEEVEYKSRVFQLSDSDFPDGTLKFANFSNSPIQGMLGKGNVAEIKPGRIETLRYKGKPGESIGVVFMYQQRESEKWRRMIATRWAVPKDGRRLMVAYQEPGGRTVRTKTLPIRH